MLKCSDDVDDTIMIEKNILWQLFLERHTLFLKKSFSELEPFMLGLGYSLVPLLSYNLAWHGAFRTYVCKKLKVFNWDNIDEKVLEATARPKDLENMLKYQKIISAEEKTAKYIVVNWLDAIADGKTDQEAFDCFFELLCEFSIDAQLNNARMKFRRTNDDRAIELQALLVKHKRNLWMLIGTVNSLRLYYFIRGFLWGNSFFEMTDDEKKKNDHFLQKAANTLHRREKGGEEADMIKNLTFLELTEDES